MLSSACDSASLSRSPFVDDNDVKEPRRGLPPINGSSSDEGAGEGGPGAIFDYLLTPSALRSHARKSGQVADLGD